MNPVELDAVMLRHAGRIPPHPCLIKLDGGRQLHITQWLRIQPGKRLTGQGQLEGRQVIAKLFIDSANSERHRQRESQGIDLLHANGLPSPHLVATGKFSDSAAYVLTEYLPDTHRPDPDSINDLTGIFRTVGQLHACGLLHDDAHLGNFLLDGRGCHIIDGDAVCATRDPERFKRNLALLIAQLPPESAEKQMEALLAAYRNGNPECTIAPGRLTAETAKARHIRLQRYLEKTLRDSTAFQVSRRWDRFVAVVREEAEMIAPIIVDPNRWIDGGTPLKQGRSATLSLVEHQGRKLVIKRYNIKNIPHALSRCWRPSRAWHAWIEGHRLRFLGIATPRPLALIERRLGPLRSTAWLITEYCPGEKLSERFLRHLVSPQADELAAIRTLLKQLGQHRITHGDMKASNLLWHEGRISVIDLDATRQHGSEASYARAREADVIRLLRNCPEESPLYIALAEVVLQADQAALSRAN